MVRSRGRPDKTYVDSLRADTGLNDTGEMGRLMASFMETAHQYSDAEAALSQVSQVSQDIVLLEIHDDPFVTRLFCCLFSQVV